MYGATVILLYICSSFVLSHTVFCTYVYGQPISVGAICNHMGYPYVHVPTCTDTYFRKTLLCPYVYECPYVYRYVGPCAYSYSYDVETWLKWVSNGRMNNKYGSGAQ